MCAEQSRGVTEEGVVFTMEGEPKFEKFEDFRPERGWCLSIEMWRSQSSTQLASSLVEAYEKYTLVIISIHIYSIREFCLKSRFVPDYDSTV